jgi:hypothetical protein
VETVRRDASPLIEALLGLEDNFWSVERDENNIRHISSRATGHDKTSAWYEALVLPFVAPSFMTSITLRSPALNATGSSSQSR